MDRTHHQIYLHTDEFRNDTINIEFQQSPMILYILHQVQHSVCAVCVCAVCVCVWCVCVVCVCGVCVSVCGVCVILL